MNVQDYRAAGLPLSIQIDQEVVDVAVADVMAAYITPIAGSEVDTDEDVVKAAILYLSFLLIMQRRAVATRAGGKEKQTAQSTTPTQAELLQQYARTCDMRLQVLRNSDIAVDADADVRDICGIYFKTNYFYN